MNGERLYQKLKSMSEEDRKKEIIIEDYSGVAAQFITLEEEVILENGRKNDLNDPRGILKKDYISINADASHYLG